MPHQVFEHTADIGLRITARDFHELLRDAAAGLFDLVTDAAGVAQKGVTVRESFSLRAEDEKELLFAWLRELLYRFAVGRSVFWDFQFTALERDSLEAEAAGGSFDPACDESRHEVKAVTRHGFQVERDKDGWRAEVIFDI